MVGMLECRSPETGKALWSEGDLLGPDADHHFEAAVFTIAGEHIFLHDEENLILGRIGPDGYTYLWHSEIKGPAAQPVVGDGRLFLRSAHSGELSAFNLKGLKE